MVMFNVNGQEIMYLPWTWEGNDRDYLRFMAIVLGGYAYISY